MERTPKVQYGTYSQCALEREYLKMRALDELGLSRKALIHHERSGVQAKDKEKRFTYLLGTPVTLADILARLKPLEDLGSSSLILLQLLHLKRLATTASLLGQILKGLLNELDILDAQLLADDSQIPNRVNITLNVDNLGIIEAAHHLEDGVDGTDVRQERVTETGTGGRTAGQTGDIVDSQVGRHLRLGLVVLAEPVEPLIGDNDAGLFGVDGGVRKVGRVTQGGLGDGLE